MRAIVKGFVGWTLGLIQKEELRMRKPVVLTIATTLVVAAAALPTRASAAQSINVPRGARVQIQGTTVRMSVGGITGTYSCSCQNGNGTCKVRQGPHTIICEFGKENACTGDCVINTTTGGLGGVGPPARINPGTGGVPPAGTGMPRPRAPRPAPSAQ